MIYPKEYTLQLIEQEENTAFVIMPFKDEFNEVYGEICQICIDLGIKCLRADEIFTNRAIMQNILERIAKAEILIADLTEKNPNVYYEVGIAHSLRDEDSVILITKDLKTSPFDITHRSLLIYDIRNLMKFRNDLKRRILLSKSISRRKDFFRTYLLSNGIKKNEIDVFIDVCDKLSQNKLELIYDIIRESTIDYEELEIEKLLDFFPLLEDYRAGALKRTASLLKMEVFSSDIILNRFDRLAKKLLIKSNKNLIHLDDVEVFNFVVEYCFKLIEKQVLKDEALNWLLDYLNNYRMGRVDIVRSKIENFLIRTIDTDVDFSVLHMLKSEHITVRESAADICGQKQLVKAIPLLMQILKIEENPHVVRSSITALTRLNALEAAPLIHEWMISNQDKWGPQAVSGSLKSIALSALKELDKEGSYLEKFQQHIMSK